MKGSVRKRGNTWSYYFDTGIVDGKRQKREKGGFRTRKEAENALAKALTEYNETGSVFEASDITVADYLDQWYELHCKMNLKYNTQLEYLRTIKNHLVPRFGSLRVRALTPRLLQEYANDLKASGLAKATIVNIMCVLSASLDYAVEPMQYIQASPMRYVKIPKIERQPRERIVLSLEDWDRIVERFPEGTRFHIPLLIGFYCGLRISETFGLTWDDIDLEKRELTVNKQILKRNHGADVRRAAQKMGFREARSSWYLQTPKTSTSTRTIKFGKTLADALVAEKLRQDKNELQYGDSYTLLVLATEKDEKGNDMLRLVPVQKYVQTDLPRARMVCVGENGEYTSTDSFKYAARVIHHDLGIDFDYHALRHTHATMLIEGGANIKDVQKRLGHANIQTTLQTYVHDTEKMASDSVDIFERAAARQG